MPTASSRLRICQRKTISASHRNIRSELETIRLFEWNTRTERQTRAGQSPEGFSTGHVRQLAHTAYHAMVLHRVFHPAGCVANTGSGSPSMLTSRFLAKGSARVSVTQAIRKNDMEAIGLASEERNVVHVDGVQFYADKLQGKGGRPLGMRGASHLPQTGACARRNPLLLQTPTARVHVHVVPVCRTRSTPEAMALSLYLPSSLKVT